jgi:Kef-type K+ transport system membrane component KefB
VARSPSSAIAIISETKAKGDYTDTVLGVTVVMDVVIIMLFAVVISV